MQTFMSLLQPQLTPAHVTRIARFSFTLEPAALIGVHGAVEPRPQVCTCVSATSRVDVGRTEVVQNGHEPRAKPSLAGPDYGELCGIPGKLLMLLSRDLVPE